ncbi:MAG: HDOD domain-containing protein [Chitinivibrionales bacterium]|nr:HDOD domain-containing protein [Chitinivibrionales bacterium]MBD3357582.1 HDOD domain-containing protein [Chitinivibrionales bacterium]
MSILQRLAGIKDLPTLPEIVLRVQKLVGSDEADARRMARIIQQDPSLASRILQVANSAFYTTPTSRISSVALAVTRLGMLEVRNIALAVNIVAHFSGRGSTLGYKGFWRHCLTAAYLNQAIFEMIEGSVDKELSQQLFMAGLLHDIGILVLDQFFHDSFGQVARAAISEEVSYLQAEEKVLGAEAHPAIGGALLEHWRFDPTVVAAVRYHHAPEKAPLKHRAAVSVTYLAEHTLCNSRIGSLEGTMPDPPNETCCGIAITPEVREKLLEKAETEVERADLILTLDSGGRTGLLRPV